MCLYYIIESHKLRSLFKLIARTSNWKSIRRIYNVSIFHCWFKLPLHCLVSKFMEEEIIFFKTYQSMHVQFSKIRCHKDYYNQLWAFFQSKKKLLATYVPGSTIIIKNTKMIRSYFHLERIWNNEEKRTGNQETEMRISFPMYNACWN